MLIYHALFQSYISYGIIAWGGACNNNNLDLLQNIILKIITRGNIDECPLNLTQSFAFESLLHNYESLKNE